MGLLETRWVVSLSTFVVLCLRRFDEASTLFVAGAICNAVLSKVLKRCFNAARPAGARLADPGMPSSHAQSLFFFAAYLGAAARDSVAIGRLLGPDAPRRTVDLVRGAVAVGLVVAALALSLQRVAAGLHTLAQVVVGGVVGGVCGLFWLRSGQPALATAIGGAAHPAAALGLVAAGALVVGSAERALATSLKRRARAHAD